MSASDVGSDRRVWAKEEDDAIRELVAKYGTKTWSVIAEQIVKEYNIEGRTGKQCRERWHNHLGIYLFYDLLGHTKYPIQTRISIKTHGPRRKSV